MIKPLYSGQDIWCLNPACTRLQPTSPHPKKKKKKEKRKKKEEKRKKKEKTLILDSFATYTAGFKAFESWTDLVIFYFLNK